MQNDSVVLVDVLGYDLRDQQGRLFTVGKLDAHRQGLLHKAVSVFVFNDKKELLLQQRASSKYHSSGKWTNTCCTHPLPRESPLMAAQRRLIEEMGLVTKLAEVFTFSYKADVGDGLIENEFDHVFFGISNQNPTPNPEEVSDWNWVSLDDIKQKVTVNPEMYTYWFRHCFDDIYKLTAKGFK